MTVALPIKNLKVRSLDLDFHEVSWGIGDSNEDVLDYTFQVLRSESPSGSFDKLTEPMDDRYVFIDNVIQIHNRWRKYFYILRVTRKSSGEFRDEGPVSHDPEPDILAREVRRHMNLLFREFAGRRCWILPVRTFGQRCECCNQITGQKRRSNCLLCYDTTWVRGYMSPIESWVQIDPSPKTNQYTNVGQQQQVNTTARLGYYPPVKPQDVLVEGENRRWRVVKVTGTEHGRAVIHQEIELHEIPRGDIEFSIPINLDTALKDLWISPARNYSNPHNLEAFEQEEIPKIYSLYASTYPPRK